MTLKGLYWWTIGILTTLLVIAVCGLTQLFVIVTGRPRDGRLPHRFAGIWGRSLFHLTPGWRIEVVGREMLPKEGEKPAVLVSNHESMTDIFAMYFLATQFRWLSKQEVFDIPLVGACMSWCDYVPVRRGDKDSQKAALDESALRLAKGYSMFFFPEGTRSDDGSIRPFKAGAFKLARDAQAKVFPIIIHGARDLMAKGSKSPGKARVTIKVLPALPPPPPAASTEALTEYADQIRTTIVREHAAIAAAKGGTR